MAITRFIRADHAENGDLWAAWNPDINHVEPSIRTNQFSARLSPFPTREAAEHALLDAGAVVGASGDGR